MQVSLLLSLGREQVPLNPIEFQDMEVNGVEEWDYPASYAHHSSEPMPRYTLNEESSDGPRRALRMDIHLSIRIQVDYSVSV